MPEHVACPGLVAQSVVRSTVEPPLLLLVLLLLLLIGNIAGYAWQLRTMDGRAAAVCRLLAVVRGAFQTELMM